MTVGLAALALAALAMSIYSLPTKLTVAVGPDDRDHSQLLATFARKLQADRAPVRLSLVRSGGFADAAKAMEAGKVDLAVVRSDGMPKNGQTVAVLHESPVLFITPAGSKIREVSDLARRRVGVARGSDENMRLLDVILRQAGVDTSRVSRVALEPVNAAAAVSTRQVDVLMLVGPVDLMADRTMRQLEKTMRGHPSVFGVAEAEAIAKRDPALESIEVPRGALGGSPATPAEDMTTLATTQRLVANAKLGSAVVNDVTRLLFTSRVALAAEHASAKSIQAPDTDAGAALPLHPGASTYLSGERNGFFDRYGDLVYMGSMLAAMVASGIGSLVSFVLGQQRRNAAQFTNKLLDLLERARKAESEAELQTVERDADDLLALAFKRVSGGTIDGDQFTTFATINDSVHLAIERRSRQLNAGAATAAPADAPTRSTDG